MLILLIQSTSLSTITIRSIYIRPPTPIRIEHFNVGSLKDWRTGKYLRFTNVNTGLEALCRQVELYKSGKSKYTDSTTTLRQLIDLYVGNRNNYHRKIAKDLKVIDTTLIHTINTDSLVKYIIKYEQGYYFKQLYK